VNRPPRPEYSLPELSEDQLKAKQEVEELTARIKELGLQKWAIRKDCKHVWVPVVGRRDSNPYEWLTYAERWDIQTGASCLVCGEDSYSWYCLASPINICEYDESTRDEDCIHCGHPEERK
jgi:hypothetical protein